MTVRDCRVRTVRLRARDDAHVRRGAILLEDALRVASVPGADGARLFVVRSLDVGVIRRDRSSSTLALALEARLARLARDAIHASATGAAAADAVYFGDDVEPLVLLAVRAAAGRAADEWFWHRVAPRALVAGAAASRLVALLHAAAAHATGTAAVRRLVRALDDAGSRDLLLAALSADDAHVLLARAGWRVPDERLDEPRVASARTAAREPDHAAGTRDVTNQPAATATRATPRDVETLRRWTARWAPGDPRAAWLACLTVALAEPWRAAGDPALPRAAAALLREARSSPTVDEGSARAAFTAPSSDRLVAAATRDPAVASGPIARPVESRCVDDDVRSRHAGLLLLVPLLDRLDIAAALRDDAGLATSDFARALLDRAAARLGVPANDAARLALGSSTAETVMPDARGALARWLRAMRGYGARRLGITLREIVGRPGRVRATPTHVDVFFGHRAVDLRLRRAALDVDPGWVPWLGRVVQFHYGEEGDDVG
jgi:hypothetical protein